MGKLLVHRIPVNVLSKDLESILPGDFTVQVKVCATYISCFSPLTFSWSLLLYCYRHHLVIINADE